MRNLGSNWFGSAPPNRTSSESTGPSRPQGLIHRLWARPIWRCLPSLREIRCFDGTGASAACASLWSPRNRSTPQRFGSRPTSPTAHYERLTGWRAIPSRPGSNSSWSSSPRLGTVRCDGRWGPKTRTSSPRGGLNPGRSTRRSDPAGSVGSSTSTLPAASHSRFAPAERWPWASRLP